MLATSVDPASGLPRGPEWAFEVKWDGVRVLAEVVGGRVRLLSRSGRDVTVAYPELDALAALPDVMLDGEVVALQSGLPSFAALAARMHVLDAARAAALARAQPVTYLVFDLLRLERDDLTRRPLRERRELLQSLPLAAPAQLSPAYDDGAALLEATREQGLEGVLAKRWSSRYEPGRRSTAWLKLAHRRSRAAVVAGWRPEPASARLGSVLLAAPDAEGALQYLGRAGSGLAGALGERLRMLLEPHARTASPLAVPVPAADRTGTRWVEPEVVVDVAYLLRTDTGRLRHPVVRGVRDDVGADAWEQP